MLVTEEMFIALTKQYLSDVGNEALAQFRGGAAHDRCIKLAIDIVEARDLEKLRMQQELAGGAIVSPFGGS